MSNISTTIPSAVFSYHNSYAMTEYECYQIKRLHKDVPTVYINNIQSWCLPAGIETSKYDNNIVWLTNKYVVFRKKLHDGFKVSIEYKDFVYYYIAKDSDLKIIAIQNKN